MLGQGRKETEKEVECILEQDWELRDSGGGGQGEGKGFDVRPCQVDIEEEEKNAEAGYRGLVRGMND